MMIKTVLALAAAAFTVSATSRLGPPLICFPLDVGSARTIPESGLDREGVVRETLAVLDASRETLVHSETLRRATIIAFDAAPRAECMRELEVALLDRALRAQLGAKPDALKLHDVGLLFEMHRAMDGECKLSGVDYLKRAVEAMPSDAAARLSLAGALFMVDTSKFGKGGPADAREQYLEAIRRSADGSLERKNSVAAAKHFLGEETVEQALKGAPSKQ